MKMTRSSVRRIVIKTGIEMGNKMKSAYSLVEDNHYIMYSYTVIYARTLIDTCICIKQDSRDFFAWRLSIRDIKRLLLSKESRESTIEKFCAWVGEH